MAILFFILGAVFITLGIIIEHLKARYKFTTNDALLNVFYKIRFWFYRNFKPGVFSNESNKLKPGWTLLFNDDFEEESWDQSGNKKWRVGARWGEFHPDDPGSYFGEPAILEGSSCALFTCEYNPQTFPDDYKTGAPITIPIEKSVLTSKLRTQYGRYECRMTLPMDRGSWPAFWQWGQKEMPGEFDSEGNPVLYYAEIDCGEWYGKKNGSTIGKQKINLHWWRTANNKIARNEMHSWGVKIENKKGNAAANFHEYAYEWREDRIEMFTDGVKIFQFTNREILDNFFNRETAQLWMVINHGIDSNIIGSKEEYYSEFMVDYIRAYKED